MILRLFPFFLRSLLAAIAGCAAFAAEPAARKGGAKKGDVAPRIPADLQIRKDIVFKVTPKGGSEILDLWLFEPLVKKYPRAPLVVYIHGGGWGNGDKTRVFRGDTIEVIRELNRQGIACATIEYRLANGGAATAYDSAADCKDAVRFLAKNAERFSLDPKRIGTFGGSAGGHLTLVTALGDDADYPCDPALDKSGAVIRCVAAYYPVECIISHGAGHGFGGSEINPNVAEINRRTIAFFVKYLTAP